MRLIYTLKNSPAFLCLLGLLLLQEAAAQVCGAPGTTLYGLDGNGAIYPINNTNGVVSGRINPAYPGNAPSSPNAMGYSPTSNRFYFFKRNEDQPTPEFVSFNVATNNYTILASCPSTANIKTGCVNANATGYYCIDANANLYFYRFTSNQWRLITNTFIDQWGTNVTATLSAHSSGDIAIDGAGNLWFLCSDNATYGLYRINGPLPTTAVASLVARQQIAPTTPTPNGNTFAGVAFGPTGQMFLSQYGSDRLYRMNTNLTLSLIGNTSTSGVGHDLTSCVFPLAALATDLTNFTVEARGSQQAFVSWTSTNEQQKGYFVEFSTDAENWQTLGYVESNGNVSAENKYSFVSSTVVNGRNYYRLRYVGFDGEYSYSQVKSIDIKHNNQVAIGPNPTRDHLVVKNYMSASSKGFVYDINGRLIKEFTVNKGINVIPMNNALPGTYLIRVIGQHGELFHEKILKE